MNLLWRPGSTQILLSFSHSRGSGFGRGTWEKSCASLGKPLYLSKMLLDSRYNVVVSGSFLPLGGKDLESISLVSVSGGPRKQSQTLSFSQSRDENRACMQRRMKNACYFLQAGEWCMFLGVTYYLGISHSTSCSLCCLKCLILKNVKIFFPLT